LIGEALKLFGWQPEPEFHPLPVGGESDADTPWRQLDEEALAGLDRWVPALELYRWRRKRGGYETVAYWRFSNRFIH
jgi:hypothetical protein